MSAKAERSAKRRISLVGGGFRWNRVASGSPGGSMKAKRRALLKQAMGAARAGGASAKKRLKAVRAALRAERRKKH